MSAQLEAPGTELHALLDAQRAAFQRDGTPDRARRLRSLNALLDAILDHEQDLVDAVSADFGNRAPQETRLLEIFPTVDEIRHTRAHLRQWMKPKRVAANWQFATGSGRIIYQP